MKGNDRPIKINPSGKYNLDFIDWNNEWAAVYNNGYRHDGKMDCNCYTLIKNAQFQECHLIPLID